MMVIEVVFGALFFFCLGVLSTCISKMAQFYSDHEKVTYATQVQGYDTNFLSCSRMNAEYYLSRDVSRYKKLGYVVLNEKSSLTAILGEAVLVVACKIIKE